MPYYPSVQGAMVQTFEPLTQVAVEGKFCKMQDGSFWALNPHAPCIWYVLTNFLAHI